MNENIVTWNATNWITVTLMAAVGLAVSGLIVGMIKSAPQNGY